MNLHLLTITFRLIILPLCISGPIGSQNASDAASSPTDTSASHQSHPDGSINSSQGITNNQIPQIVKNGTTTKNEPAPAMAPAGNATPLTTASSNPTRDAASSPPNATYQSHSDETVNSSQGLTPGTTDNQIPQIVHNGNPNYLASQTGYHIAISKSDDKGICASTMNIFGNGIDKSITYPCGKEPAPTINLGKILLIGDEFFTDKDFELISLSLNKCTKETYHSENNQLLSTSSALSDSECQQVKAKMSLLRAQQTVFAAWYSDMQQRVQAQLQVVQQAVANLTQLLNTGLFQQTDLPFDSLYPSDPMKVQNNFNFMPPFPNFIVDKILQTQIASLTQSKLQSANAVKP